KMKNKLKNKFKKLILTVTLSVAMILGAISGLLLPLSKIEKTFAEYPTTQNTYDFDSTSGWTTYRTDNNDLINKFNESSSSVKSNSSAFTEIDAADKPSKSFDNETDFSDNDAFMMFKANEAPVKTKVVTYKKDSDGNFIYEKTDDVINEYESIPETESEEDYVKIEDNKYYKKVKEENYENSYYAYKTSSSISLTKNSYYVISAYVWTKNAIVSISAKDSNDEFVASYNEVTSEGTWKQIFLFIETSSEDVASVYLYVFYGSENGLITNASAAANDAITSGFVYVDHVVVQKISEIEYNNKTVDGKTTTDVNASYSARYNYDNVESLIANPTFQNDIEAYAYMYGQDEFNSALANVSYQKYVNKYTSDDSTTKLSQNQLENIYRAYNNKFTYSIVTEAEEFKTTDENDQDVLAKDTFQTGNKVLKLENTSEKYALGLLTPTITLSQFGYYKLSLWVKATDEDAEATVKLISYIKDGNSMSLTDLEDGKMIIKSQSVTGFTNDDDFTNGWVEVAFYIQENVYRNATFQIALLANAESTVYFDNIRLYAITSTAYSNATTATKFDMAPSSLVISGGITNGYFDFIKTEKATKAENLEAPYTPASWTELSDNDKDVVAGIISTTDDNYTDTLKAKIGGVDNPLAGKGYDANNDEVVDVLYPRTNVLAIYAPNDDLTKTYNYVYKSASFSLSSSSVYKITFESLTANTGAAFNGKIVARLTYSDNTVSSYEDVIGAGNGKWTTYTIVVRTGNTSRSCYLELGVKDAQGTIFFQKVGYTKLESKTVDGETIAVDDQYTNLLSANGSIAEQNANKVKFVDFGSDATVIHANEKLDDKDYYEAQGFNIAEVSEGKTSGVIGIVDTTANVVLNTETTLNQAFLANNASANDLALLIYNSENAASNVSSKYTTTLSSSSYYEISVYVKTAKLANSKGLTIDMSKISATFNNINTGALNSTENGYVKYTVFVKTGSSSVSDFNINYILGTEDDEISGIALVSGANIKKFANADAYNAAIENVDEDDATTIVKDLTTSSSEEGSKKAEEQATNFTLATFFLILSSILLAVALIIALIAVYVKRIPRHKHVTGTNKVSVKKNKKSTRDTSKDGFV
ncbi:MAG: hypothetical protein IJS74_00520, partial [Clostridia bacterium]|nr:hypothetical protein [Clostridia bacterium]